MQREEKINKVIAKIKSHNQIESFDRKKLYESIIMTCLSARRPEGQAESIAKAVCDGVEQWLVIHPEVTSHDIRRIADQYLEVYDPESAYLYGQHHITL